ncbi:3-hydroxybutyryl-CoA dehydrogenase [Myxococcota bacterium]|nr:3-hydroxybutyryl-CoA dehydrogenase [Myxococcota bacterium]MBU1430839.1 3-hydroxybutyryl-CoA dehydrogenase [Myxococcota bacterium]MBU1897352.1 3-hydroxybutyryl-CoA dehydrogenase [Myxococcota bacterium]
MKIETIGVIGAGQMGAGIAHVAATVGLKVLLADANLERAEAGKADIAKRMAGAVSKGKMSAEDRDAALARIVPVADLTAFNEVHFAVEAVSENEALKKTLFKQLDEVCSAEVILATNTSSIPITRIAAVTRRPAQVIGMHFMNPVPVMKLVELIRGLATSDETYATVKALAERMGKTTVVARDMPGFIINRILMPMINEAVVALYEGIGAVEDIDVGMKLGTNQPMGPLTLADFIGLDTCLAIMEVLYEGTADSKYRPCPLLRQYVDAGWLGRKSGRGFYDYNKG